MHDTLLRVVTEWPEFDNDEPVTGSDLVEWFGEFRQEVRDVLEQEPHGPECARRAVGSAECTCWKQELL